MPRDERRGEPIDPLVSTSRRLAFLLRHRPDAAGLTLEPGGWAPIDAVLAALGVERSVLDAVLTRPGKRRFEIAGRSIRALHGHSVEVAVDHPATTPPEVLFHGTVSSRLPSITRRGLVRGRRAHVHLSEDRDEARETGARYGSPIVIEVRALALSRERGAKLLRVPGSTVWLVDAVPADYLVLPR